MKGLNFLFWLEDLAVACLDGIFLALYLDGRANITNEARLRQTFTCTADQVLYPSQATSRRFAVECQCQWVQ